MIGIIEIRSKILKVPFEYCSHQWSCNFFVICSNYVMMKTCHISFAKLVCFLFSFSSSKTLPRNMLTLLHIRNCGPQELAWCPVPEVFTFDITTEKCLLQGIFCRVRCWFCMCWQFDDRWRKNQQVLQGMSWHVMFWFLIMESLHDSYLEVCTSQLIRSCNSLVISLVSKMIW